MGGLNPAGDNSIAGAAAGNMAVLAAFTAVPAMCWLAFQLFDPAALDAHWIIHAACVVAIIGLLRYISFLDERYKQEVSRQCILVRDLVHQGNEAQNNHWWSAMQGELENTQKELHACREAAKLQEKHASTERQELENAKRKLNAVQEECKAKQNELDETWKTLNLMQEQVGQEYTPKQNAQKQLKDAQKQLKAVQEELANTKTSARQFEEDYAQTLDKVHALEIEIKSMKEHEDQHPTPSNPIPKPRPFGQPPLWANSPFELDTEPAVPGKRQAALRQRQAFLPANSDFEITSGIGAKIQVTRHVYNARGGAPPYRGAYLTATDEVILDGSVSLGDQKAKLVPASGAPSMFGAQPNAELYTLPSGQAAPTKWENEAALGAEILNLFKMGSEIFGTALEPNRNKQLVVLIPMMGMD